MDFVKNNKFLIICILALSACGYFVLYIQEGKKENNLIEVEELEVEESVIDEIEIMKIYVDIAGEVVNPGVYILDEGSRVNDVINLAGGVTEDANLDNVNLAYLLSDGIKITIPNKNDINPRPILQSSLSYSIKNEVVNINQATVEDLISLSGIGESIAKDIIQYRNKNGDFKRKEDIKNVPGIGEAKYKKIQDKIIV